MDILYVEWCPIHDMLTCSNLIQPAVSCSPLQGATRSNEIVALGISKLRGRGSFSLEHGHCVDDERKGL